MDEGGRRGKRDVTDRGLGGGGGHREKGGQIEA